MGWHSGSGDHENTVKTHKNGESNFHLKEWLRPGPTKQSGAIPAEGSHRGRRLAQQIGDDSSSSHFDPSHFPRLYVPAKGIILPTESYSRMG